MHCRRENGSRHRGFSFVEVLFAVIILGIGFIMVAAIFPVALQQTKLTSEQVTSASTGRNGVAIVSGVASDTANNPVTGQSFDSTKTNVVPTSGMFYPTIPTLNGIPYTPPSLFEPLSFVPIYEIDEVASHLTSKQAGAAAPPTNNGPTQFPYLKGTVGVQKGNLSKYVQQSLLNASDPRSACVLLYSRQGYFNDKTTWENQVKVIAIPVQSRVNSVFSATDFAYNLQPHPVRFAVLPKVAAAGGVDLIVFDVTNAPTADETYSVIGANGAGGAAVEGACVVVGNDNISAPTHDVGRMNGRIFKLGSRRSELDALVPSLTYSVAAGGTTYTGNVSGSITSGVVYELDPSTPMSIDLGQDDTGTIAPPVIVPGLAPIVALGVTGSAVTFKDMDSQSGTRHYNLAEGWIVGRGLTDPAVANIYEGLNMAGDAYSSSVLIQ